MSVNVAELSTAAIADACVLTGVSLRAAPASISLQTGMVTAIAGPARAVKHLGSVDVFLEAISLAAAGDVLVVDNGSRSHEGCIGDLVALEAAQAGIAGIVIWGRHRDTRQIAEIGLPLWSEGSVPTGPVELRRLADSLVRVGDSIVASGDLVVADADGVVFVDQADVERVVARAEVVAERERNQATLARAGRSLREQLQFADYLRRRAKDPLLTFRAHLRRIDGEIEA